MNILGKNKTKYLEEQLGAVESKLAKAYKELDKKTLALSLLFRLNNTVAAAKDPRGPLKALLDMFIEFMPAETAAVLLEDSGEFLVKEFWHLDGDSLRSVKMTAASGLAKVLKERRTASTKEDLYKRSDLLENNDLVNMRYLKAEVFIPLFYREELLGMVTLGDLRGEARMSETMGLLDVLAQQAGLALANERFSRELESLRKEQEKKGSDLMHLQRINRVFSSLLDTEKLKSLTLSLVSETVDVKSVILFLRNEEEILLVPVASAGIPEIKTKQIDFEIDNDFIKKLRENKKPFLIEASRIKETLDSYKCNQDASAALAESALTLYIPFISNERVVALLALGPKRSGEVFNSVDLELLSTIAFQFAVAIDNAKLFESGVTDGLTNVYTHRFFQKKLEYELQIGMRSRTRRVLCLIMVDVDHFKNINDTYGHQIGDKILRDFAKILLSKVRMTDIVARYGGEEFVILMPEADLKTGEMVAERMRQAIANYTFLPQELSLKVTASFGVAAYPDCAATKEELISEADKALYKSKEQGRNRTTLSKA